MRCARKDNALLLTWFTASRHSNVSLKLLQAEGWSSGSWRIIVNMSANTSNCPCKQDSGKEYCGQRKCHRVLLFMGVQSVLYIHGSLECSNLFCALSCCLKSWASRMMVTCVRNVGVNKFFIARLILRNFNMKNYNMKICNTNIFQFTVAILLFIYVDCFMHVLVNCKFF